MLLLSFSAPQLFHSGPIHHPHPPSTPTGNQHSAPSPGQPQVPYHCTTASKHRCIFVRSSPCFSSQVSQGGPQFPSGGLVAHTPPILQQGHSSPQTVFPMQGYSLPAHSFSSISQLPRVNMHTVFITENSNLHEQLYFSARLKEIRIYSGTVLPGYSLL